MPTRWLCRRRPTSSTGARLTNTGLDLSAALTALNATSLGALTDSVDLEANGNVALDALNGTVVATGGFTIQLGQIRARTCRAIRRMRMWRLSTPSSQLVLISLEQQGRVGSAEAEGV